MSIVSRKTRGSINLLFPVNVSHSYISFKNAVVETIYHFDIKDLFSLEYDMII